MCLIIFCTYKCLRHKGSRTQMLEWYPHSPVFHVSMLKKYHGDMDYIIKWDSVLLDKDLQYKRLFAILDHDIQKLRTKEIMSVKVQWKHSSVEEATWEIEKDIRERYLQLFDGVDTTLPLLQPVFPSFITRGRVMDKLVYIITTCSYRYRKANMENLVQKTFEL